MYQRTESFFPGYQDLKLFYQRWIPSGAAGQIIVTHGHGEHSDCYLRLAEALQGSNWSLFAWDWRGHGRSQGQRGYADHFIDYCYDFESFINYLDQKELLDRSIPTVIFGHSMGALVQLRSLLNHPEWKFSAQVLSSPLLGVAMDVPFYKEWAGQILGNLFPRFTLSSGMQNDNLSRDPEVLREYERDVLRHSRLCSGVWFGALEAMSFVFDRSEKISTPTLMQICSADKVISSTKAESYFEALKCSKTKKIYPDFKHELYNDIDRNLVSRDLTQFLKTIV